MASPTVERAHAVVRRIARIDSDPGRRDAVALGLVDAVLDRDGESLASVLDALRDARAHATDDELAGWLDAAIAVAHWGLERAPSPAAVAHGTQAHRFLAALDGPAQVGSAQLRAELETDETQVSRTGRRLLDSGLVTRHKVGREVFWRLTPRGRGALTDAPASPRTGNAAFWQEALRRGFDGERREADPVRERIIESTLGLHLEHGIRATTWSQIADAANVPVDTVQDIFPTFDDLTRSCGEHFVESLMLPPYDRAADVFAGASSENERIRRLVGTFFTAYERGADGIAVARRERTDVPAADESLQALDDSFDALVAEALRPLNPDNASISSVRALTDVEVWRLLRAHGASAESAVDDASAAVERRLAVS